MGKEETVSNFTIFTLFYGGIEMIITLTRQEVTSLMKVMDTIEENGSNELKEMLKDNKIISYKVGLTGSVEVQIKPEYMEEFLAVYEKFIGLFVSQTKALYESVCLFQQEAQRLSINTQERRHSYGRNQYSSYYGSRVHSFRRVIQF